MTSATTRSPRGRSRALRLEARDADAAIAAAERDAVVVWRNQRIPFAELPGRIAATDDRNERDVLYTRWIDVLEAVNPLFEARLERWRREAADAGFRDFALAAADGRDLNELSLELERLAINSETVYHAALRRYLALIDIEQGDATIADLWHITRGAGWDHWFGQRELERAAAEAGRTVGASAQADGWRSAEAGVIGGDPGDSLPASAVGEVYGSLVGDPAWLRRALRMASDEIASFADFAAFVRLWRVRRAVAHTHYELRLYRIDEPALQRAYFSGIMAHTTGIVVPEAAYLHDIGAPFASVAVLERTMLAGAIGERLVSRYGEEWWADERARDVLSELASARSAKDALAYLGYDGFDWRPLVRQIRTRLIGEMSGYGGPNITTRAGTRKV
jgi:hypothetical protein